MHFGKALAAILSANGGYLVIQYERGWVEYYPSTDGSWQFNNDCPGQFGGFPDGFDA